MTGLQLPGRGGIYEGPAVYSFPAGRLSGVPPGVAVFCDAARPFMSEGRAVGVLGLHPASLGVNIADTTPRDTRGYMTDISPTASTPVSAADRAFTAIFPIVVASEGGLSLVRSDPGNWTGGEVGVGELKGTMFGISAAAYPGEDIQNLTLDRAKALYWTDYWLKVRCSDLRPALALLVFDAAVNNGPRRAAEWLQTACAVGIDGTVGPVTIRAANTKPLGYLCAEFLSQRLDFMAGLDTWSTFGLGWSRRLTRLAFHTAHLAAYPP